MSAWGARRSGSEWDYDGYRDEAGASSDYYDDAYYDQPYYDDDAYYEEPRRVGAVVRTGRVLSGVVAGAVLVLAVIVGVAQYLAGERGFPGPGSMSVAAHVVAAVVVVAAQVTADRKRGFISLGAALVVIFTASILLFTQWWG